jgi:hypothetical protein
MRTTWLIAMLATVAAAPQLADAEPDAPLQVGVLGGFASGTDGGSFDDGVGGFGVDAVYRVASPYGDVSLGGTVTWARWESRTDRTEACWDQMNGTLRFGFPCMASDTPVDIERDYVRSSALFEGLARWHMATGPVRPYAQLGAGVFRLSDYYATRYRDQNTGDLAVDEDGTSVETGLVLSIAAGVHVPITEALMVGAGIEQHTQRRPGDEVAYFEDIRMFAVRVTANWQ